jgi:virginiamycin B lyase
MTSSFVRVFAAAVAVAAGSACAVAPSRTWPAPGPMRLEDPTQQLQYRGFSLLPPDGPGWFAIPSPPTQPGPVYLVAAFAKEPVNAGAKNVHTVGATISTWDVGSKRFDSPAAFLQFEEAGVAAAVNAQCSPRHRVLASKVALDDSLGPNCIRYDQSVEDTGVSAAPGSPFILEMHGYRCLHPKWPRYVIDVGYSERYPSGEPSFRIEGEVAPFLKSLSFANDRPLFVTTIAIGAGPQGVVAGAGSIWVAYGDDHVARIDANTNQVAAKIQVGRDPVGITFASGSVWVANRGDGTVARIDPGTNQVSATVAVGGQPFMIAAGAGSVWVTNSASGEVTRIDPATNRIVARTAVGPEPSNIIVDSTAAWVTLWRQAKLVRIDPSTSLVVASIPVPRGAGDIAVGEGSVWVASQYEGMVARVDPRTNQVLATIPLQTRPSGIAVGPDAARIKQNAVWVTRYDEASISRIDPRTNQPIGRPIAVGVRPVSMIFAEDAFWVSNAFSASVSRVDL